MSKAKPPAGVPAPAGWETVVTPRCLADIRHWVETDRTLALRLLTLLDVVSRDPFKGIGKPEPLVGLGSGFWSRRINQEHRLVYRIENRRVTFLTARYHYEK